MTYFWPLFWLTFLLLPLLPLLSEVLHIGHGFTRPELIVNEIVDLLPLTHHRLHHGVVVVFATLGVQETVLELARVGP